MKQIKSKRNPLLFVGLAALVVGAGVVAMLWLWPKAQPASSDNTERANDIKQSQPLVDDSDSETGTETPVNTTSENVPTDDSLHVTIGQFTQSQGQVRSSATISGQGTCVFLYSSEDTKPVVDEVTSAGGVCESSVSEVNFSKLGSWKLKVTYYSGDKKAEETRDVTIH